MIHNVLHRSILFIILLFLALLFCNCAHVIQPIYHYNFNTKIKGSQNLALCKEGRTGIVVYGITYYNEFMYPGAGSRHYITQYSIGSFLLETIYLYSLGFFFPLPRTWYENGHIYNNEEIKDTRIIVEKELERSFSESGFSVDLIEPYTGRIRNLIENEREKYDYVCVVRFTYNVFFNPGKDGIVDINCKASVFSTKTKKRLILMRSQGEANFETFKSDYKRKLEYFINEYKEGIEIAKRKAIKEMINKLGRLL